MAHIDIRMSLGGLEETSRTVQDAGHLGLLNAAEHIKGETQQRTPVESGHLRDSEDVQDKSFNDVDVYVPGPYARWQEFGPDFDPWVLKHEEGESPYLSTTVEAEAERALELIAAKIREGLGNA